MEISNYQVDDFQVFLVGSLRHEQLFGDVVRLLGGVALIKSNQYLIIHHKSTITITMIITINSIIRI